MNLTGASVGVEARVYNLQLFILKPSTSLSDPESKLKSRVFIHCQIWIVKYSMKYSPVDGRPVLPGKIKGL